MAWKWMDNRSLLLLSSALERMNDMLSVQRREQGSKTKSSVPCPKVVKLCSGGMGGVDFWTSVLPDIVWIEITY